MNINISEKPKNQKFCARKMTGAINPLKENDSGDKQAKVPVTLNIEYPTLKYS